MSNGAVTHVQRLSDLSLATGIENVKANCSILCSCRGPYSSYLTTLQARTLPEFAGQLCASRYGDVVELKRLGIAKVVGPYRLGKNTVTVRCVGGEFDGGLKKWSAWSPCVTLETKQPCQ